MTELPPSNLPYLFAAFAVVWVVFFIYAAYMSWRRQSAQRELERCGNPAPRRLMPTDEMAKGAGRYNEKPECLR